MALVWHEKANRTALQTSLVLHTHTLLVQTHNMTTHLKLPRPNSTYKIYFQIMKFKEKKIYKRCNDPSRFIYDLYIIFCPVK